MTDSTESVANQSNPTTQAEATAMLQNIADQMDQMNADYRQLQLRAAWLQGWLANHAAQPAHAQSPAVTSHTKKKP